MKWPWHRRAELAEQKSREAEVDLLHAQTQYHEARQVADEARQSRRENGYAELIRLAMGVNR